MLFTTFAKLHEHGACMEGYINLHGLWVVSTSTAKTMPISLEKILESNGLQDTIWSLRATMESSENLLTEFVCKCAEHVLHFYEDKYPDDKRRRLAIEAARQCITNKSTAAWAAARDARDAARAAARDARDAARAAAWAAGDTGNTVWAAEDAAWAAEDAARDARDAAGLLLGLLGRLLGILKKSGRPNNCLELLNK